MNNDFYGLTIFILTILLGIRQFITSCRIDKLSERIKKLEEQVEEYAPIPYREMVKEDNDEKC